VCHSNDTPFMPNNTQQKRTTFPKTRTAIMATTSLMMSYICLQNHFSTNHSSRRHDI